MEKALIIGAAGFVGSYLIDHIQKSCIWSITVTKMEHEKIPQTGVDIRNLDILDYGQVTALLKDVRPEYIFHLAAQSSVALSWQNPELTVDVNIKGSLNVLNGVRELDYKPRILLIGSGEEYGQVEEFEIPIGEDNAVRPRNIYAVTKVCQNMMGSIYAQAYGMNVMMVRAFNHIGPKQAPQFVVSDFCKQIAAIENGFQEPVVRVGNLAVRRDFTDVRDIVRAYILLIKKGEPGQLYNVGSGQAISIREILDKIIRISRTSFSIEIDTVKMRPVDIPVIEADVTKLKRCTGWSPEILLDTTLKDILEYWRRELLG